MVQQADGFITNLNNHSLNTSNVMVQQRIPSEFLVTLARFKYI